MAKGVVSDCNTFSFFAGAIPKVGVGPEGGGCDPGSECIFGRVCGAIPEVNRYLEGCVVRSREWMYIRKGVWCDPGSE